MAAGLKVVPLLTLAFVTFTLGLGELMIAGILPAIATDLTISIPLAGQLVTVYALTFASVSPPLSIFLRARAAKRVLIASLIVVAAANGWAATAHNFLLLVSARVFAAIGSAVAAPLALAAIGDVASEELRGRAHGIVFTGFSLAAMLGVPLGALIAQFGWRWTFAAVAVLTTCAALFTARGVSVATAAPAIVRHSLWSLLEQPSLRQMLLVSTLFLTAQYAAFTYFRPYFAAANSATIQEIVWLFVVFGVCGIAGTLLGGYAVDRWGTRVTLLFTLGGCSAVFAALPLLSRSLFGSSVAVAAWALTSWGFSPAVNRRLELDAGVLRDVALALNLTAFNVGIAAGSALGGATIALAGIERLPLTATAICALALLIALPKPRPVIVRQAR